MNESNTLIYDQIPAKLMTRVVPIPIPVSEKTSDTTENACVGVGKYPSPAQIRYLVIYYSLNGIQLLLSSQCRELDFPRV